MAMDIFGKVLARIRRYRQMRAEREALRLLIARKDEHMLRDVGLLLVETENVPPYCEPMPQAKERRWTAPLIRLLPPPLRKRDSAAAAPATQGSRDDREKPAA